MSRMAELAYDIEQLWIEGKSPKAIAEELQCPESLVLEWLAQESLSDEDDFYEDDLELDTY